jgi:hypothetical protein
MKIIRLIGIAVCLFFGLGVSSLELIHVHRFGHFVPLNLHADVSISTSNNVLGVDGAAQIYEAKLTNFGLLPASVTVCEYRLNDIPAFDVNYVVERWEPPSSRWMMVPEWDFYGYRVFCRPAFETTDQHLVRRRLWPGQSIAVGSGTPGQLGGFHIGDYGRFTIFLRGDNDPNDAASTRPFLLEQEPKKP